LPDADIIFDYADIFAIFTLPFQLTPLRPADYATLFRHFLSYRFRLLMALPLIGELPIRRFHHYYFITLFAIDAIIEMIGISPATLSPLR